MFDYLFAVMGPLGSAVVLVTLLLAVTLVLFIAHALKARPSRFS